MRRIKASLETAPFKGAVSRSKTDEIDLAGMHGTATVSAPWQGLPRLHCQDCIEIELDPGNAEVEICESSNHRLTLVFTQCSKGPLPEGGGNG